MKASFAIGVDRKKRSGIAACMSPAWAWTLFLQTSGKWPASLTMPPRAPPMPTAQVLQAFFDRMRTQSFQSPTFCPFFRT